MSAIMNAFYATSLCILMCANMRTLSFWLSLRSHHLKNRRSRLSTMLQLSSQVELEENLNIPPWIVVYTKCPNSSWLGFLDINWKHSFEELSELGFLRRQGGRRYMQRAFSDRCLSSFVPKMNSVH